MSLLKILDFHFQEADAEATEIEYLLTSAGEIFPPFPSDREHSLEARHIVRTFPFKLFSVTEPYSGRPQHICATFRCRPDGLPHAAAKELAAFLSVFTRRRVSAMRQTRVDGLPIEYASEHYSRGETHFHQRLIEIDPNELQSLFAKLQRMERHSAEAFVLAMRMYHQAQGMMFTEPDISYLLLVTSVEALSSALYEIADTDAELEKYLDDAYPKWQQICDTSTPEAKAKAVGMLTTNAHRTLRKFCRFLEENLPQAFWSQNRDDAKPFYWQELFTMAGRELVESDSTIHPWEQVDRNKFQQTLKRIYKARSLLVHEAAPFPAHIVMGHFSEIPIAAMMTFFENQQKAAQGLHQDLLPPLQTFERMVSYSMVSFLRGQPLSEVRSEAGEEHTEERR